MERNQEEVRAFHLQNHQVKVTFQGFNSISDWVSGFPVSPMKINISEYYSEKIKFVEQSTSKLNFCAPGKMTSSPPVGKSTCSYKTTQTFSS